MLLLSQGLLHFTLNMHLILLSKVAIYSRILPSFSNKHEDLTLFVTAVTYSSREKGNYSGDKWLVSLFNGITTFMDYLIPKLSL